MLYDLKDLVIASKIKTNHPFYDEMKIFEIRCIIEKKKRIHRMKTKHNFSTKSKVIDGIHSCCVHTHSAHMAPRVKAIRHVIRHGNLFFVQYVMPLTCITSTLCFPFFRFLPPSSLSSLYMNRRYFSSLSLSSRVQTRLEWT